MKRWLSQLGIRWRLGLLLGAVTLLVMSLAGIYLLRQQSRLAFEGQQRRAAALLEALAVPCAQALARGDTEKLDGYLGEISRAGSRHLGLRVVALIDHSGAVLASYRTRRTTGQHGWEVEQLRDSSLPFDWDFVGEARGAHSGLWRRSGKPGSGQLQVSMPVTSGLRWGTLLATLDLTEMEARSRKTGVLMLLVALFCALCLGAALWFGLSRIVIHPVKELSAAAEAIQEGRLDVRAAPRGSDELSRLGHVFNSMAAELQSYTSELERKVEERSAELHKMVERLERLATTDELTGLHNRRHFDTVLDFEIRRSSRSRHDITLIMIDVDHFKALNDTYGHPCGDAVLRDLAQVLKSTLRSTDIVARYGGEEFVVLLLDTPRQTGLVAAEKLRCAVRDHAFSPRAVTVSLGVASYPRDASAPEELLARADAALYRAKAAGRDRVMAWAPVIQALEVTP